MKIIDLIKEELIFTKLNVETTDNLFRELSDNLIRNGYVKKSFYESLRKREQVFPTGLALEEYNVAIPHTDAEHVIKPCISIAILDNPIKFKCMEDETVYVDVNVVFMLGLNEGHNQLEMLQQLIQLIQNKSILKQMLKAKNGVEIIKIIERIS
jgi:PTS system galactitol-specific IIA component